MATSSASATPTKSSSYLVAGTCRCSPAPCLSNESRGPGVFRRDDGGRAQNRAPRPDRPRPRGRTSRPARWLRGLGRRRSTFGLPDDSSSPVSYTHLRAHETDSYLVCRLLL